MFIGKFNLVILKNLSGSINENLFFNLKICVQQFSNRVSKSCNPAITWLHKISENLRKFWTKVCKIGITYLISCICHNFTKFYSFTCFIKFSSMFPWKIYNVRHRRQFLYPCMSDAYSSSAFWINYSSLLPAHIFHFPCNILYNSPEPSFCSKTLLQQPSSEDREEPCHILH